MFRIDRAISAALLLAAGLSLSACGSSGNFDPTDWFNPDELFGSKPKLSGERKAVFPEGVPGVPEGVPREMLKGNQQAAIENPPAEPPPAAKPAPAARPAATRPPPKPRAASAPPQPAAARPAGSTQPATSAPWPDPAAAQPKPVQRTAPAAAWPEPNTQANWPPPDPSTFSR